MKLVFRTTPTSNEQRTLTKPANNVSPFLYSIGSNTNINAGNFSGSMLDRIRTSGEPCGSCGGR